MHSSGRAGAEVLDHLLRDRELLTRRQVEADRVIAAEGAGHLAHAEHDGVRANRPWRLDPIPLVIDGPAFDTLVEAVTRRVAALERLLADLYGARTTVREGLVPAEALTSSRRYRTSAVGTRLPDRWLTSYAADFVRLDDGSWRFVKDVTEAPTGIGFALIDRSVMARVAVDVLGPGGTADVASISGFQAELRSALTAATPVESPRVVVFTGGIDHPAYVEHSFLAKRLGFHLVEAADLVVRQGRLWLRTLGGVDPIDVVYRRVEADAVDPLEVAAPGPAGVPGLLFAAAERGVVLANAHGAGVIEDPELTAFWPAALAASGDGSSPLTPLDAGAGRMAGEPVFADGALGSAPVVVRVHAVVGADGARVMAGGNGRVLAPGDDPRRPTAMTAKDVWVLGSERAAPVILGPALPQVDLAGSVPTRAADALFWAGRAAERAEALARTVRVVAAKREQDPTLFGYDGGRWARRMHLVLSIARRAPSERRDHQTGAPGDGAESLAAELASATSAVGERLDEMLVDTATVGQFLSSECGRVLARIARLRDAFAAGAPPIDALDTVITELAAFAGLWNESTVRSPAWRFGDLGRRIERALIVAELVEACARGPAGSDELEAASLEVLLAANESLVAYRRSHRSDIEVGAALDLVVGDADNPRAFVAAVRRARDHCVAIRWVDGVTAADAALAALDDPDDAHASGGRRAALTAAHEAIGHLADRVVETWFATPVNPIVVRGRLR
jgi:uncharacterized circularly permuted ATP-grasp superfamily protein/uncharacterized alpha-E superfamily protein